jgi:hypothetical protein
LELPDAAAKQHAPPNQGNFRLFVNVLVNGNTVDSIVGEGVVVNSTAIFSVIGNELLQISAANTVVRFNMQIEGNPPSTFVQRCRIIFTRLQWHGGNVGCDGAGRAAFDHQRRRDQHPVVAVALLALGGVVGSIANMLA